MSNGFCKGERTRSPAKQRKRERRIHVVVRFIIQLAFFAFLPALWSTAFAGARYIAEQIYKHDAIDINPFVLMLLVLFAFTIVFGRFFCGYACAFGSLGDWLFMASAFVQKRLFKKTRMLPQRVLHALQYLKYLVLIAILAACLTGTYSVVSSADPWGLFAAIYSWNFPQGVDIYAAILLGAIVVGMLLVERFFCQFLCPLGALFALLPMLPLTIFSRDKGACLKGCNACIKGCSAAISLGEQGSKHGECFQCGKCAVKCPTGNITTGIKRIKGIETALLLAKAATLFAICYFL